MNVMDKKECGGGDLPIRITGGNAPTPTNSHSKQTVFVRQPPDDDDDDDDDDAAKWWWIDEEEPVEVVAPPSQQRRHPF